MSGTHDFSRPGVFEIGCNYWASHAGTRMWRDWQPAVVDADLQQLREAGIRSIRVFPLWEDFQPIKLLRRNAGKQVEYRYTDEQPLSSDDLGTAGISAQAIERFGAFLELAQCHGITVIVSLINGWMSGRLFVPAALEGTDLITDPAAVMWQVRFVSFFVRRFRDCDTITAWELGNECNCLQQVSRRESAWAWTAALANAIRAADPTRPVLSGMHGLDATGSWTVTDHAELLDVLTTHTYPVFTAYCDREPVNQMGTLLHATAETRLMTDLSGKPCFVEEFGTLGPMIASDMVAGEYLRASLFSLIAHDCRGLYWWCAYDQLELEFPPYEWNATECELGLFRADRTAKPAAAVVTAAAELRARLPFDSLPAHTREAVCILTAGADHWGAAYGSFILAKQAGFDIEYQYHDQPIKPAELYLMPSMAGFSVIRRRQLDQILQRVRSGATLYISNANGKLRQFSEVTGMEVQSYQRRGRPSTVVLTGTGEPAGDGVPVELPFEAPVQLELASVGAEVLGTELDGTPAFTAYRLGNGTVYFLAFPLEIQFAGMVARTGTEVPPYFQIYRRISAEARGSRVVATDLPGIGITEHVSGPDERIIIVINYTPTPLEVPLSIRAGWSVGTELVGVVGGDNRSADRTMEVSGNDACVITVTQRFVDRRLERCLHTS